MIINAKSLKCCAGAALLSLCACSQADKPNSAVSIAITNPTSLQRTNEVIEVSLDSIDAKLTLKDGEQWVVIAPTGEQVPYQISYDRRYLLIPVTVAGGVTSSYSIQKGIPETFKPCVAGKMYEQRLDDIAWENEYAGYRAYGPASQKENQNLYGYDVFTKSVDTLVVDMRYQLEFDYKPQIDSLKALGKQDEILELYKIMSYHQDHGNGMDCYMVGPTLGGGTSALIVDGKIQYPYCYQSYKILENGPIRFTVQMDFGATVVDSCQVTEHRIISCEKGSYMNKCVVWYDGTPKSYPVVAGIVIHKENTDSVYVDKENAFVSYADLTEDCNNNNGTMYLGMVGQDLSDAKFARFDKNELSLRGGAIGHVLIEKEYTPNSKFVYFFGSGWSKSNMPNMKAWNEYLKDFNQKLAQPLEVKFKN